MARPVLCHLHVYPGAPPSSGLQKVLGFILPRSREQPWHRVQVQPSSSEMEMPALLAARLSVCREIRCPPPPPSCPLSFSVRG